VVRTAYLLSLTNGCWIEPERTLEMGYMFRYPSLETAVPDLLPRRTRGLIFSSLLTRLPELIFNNVHFWRDLPLKYGVAVRQPFCRFKYQFLYPSIVLSLFCILFIL